MVMSTHTVKLSIYDGGLEECFLELRTLPNELLMACIVVAYSPS